MNSRIVEWRQVILLVVFALVAIAASALIGIALRAIPEHDFVPEIALIILLIASVVALIAIIIIAVAIFAALGLSDPREAFGLPQGSVRAIVALCLLLMFSIIAIFLYGQLRSPAGYTLRQLTLDQVAALPPEKIIAKFPSGANDGTLNVTVRENSTASDDFAKQVLTTIGTLVVAVSGFYFGARTSTAGKATSLQPTLSVVGPSSPVTLETDAGTRKPKPITVRLETKPAGLSIEVRLNGSIDQSIQPLGHSVFKYSPSTMPLGEQTLTFALAAYPDVKQEIIVKPA